MRILLDTHILLGCLEGRSRLPGEAVATIEAADEVFASVVNVWEMAIKHGLGKLDLDVAFAKLPKIITDSGYDLLDIKVEHAVRVAELPPVHRDPFDRMLVAQSIAEPMRLLTHDSQLAEYGSTILLV